MDGNSPGETSVGAFDFQERFVGSDVSGTSERLFQAAYGDLLSSKNAWSAELGERSRTGQDAPKTARDGTDKPQRQTELTGGDLQGNVPDAYLKYLNRYKDLGSGSRGPAPNPEVRPDPAPPVNPDAPSPRPDRPRPKPAPEPGPERRPEPPSPHKILPGPRPEPRPQPVKPAPEPGPEVTPTPKPRPAPTPAPRPCPRPG
ncbi:MAG TPA: hypothetical protein V6D08_18710 [Candidatus Obscuribacterales bacterium]